MLRGEARPAGSSGSEFPNRVLSTPSPVSVFASLTGMTSSLALRRQIRNAANSRSGTISGDSELLTRSPQEVRTVWLRCGPGTGGRSEPRERSPFPSCTLSSLYSRPRLNQTGQSLQFVTAWRQCLDSANSASYSSQSAPFGYQKWCRKESACPASIIFPHQKSGPPCLGTVRRVLGLNCGQRKGRTKGWSETGLAGPCRRRRAFGRCPVHTAARRSGPLGWVGE